MDSISQVIIDKLRLKIHVAINEAREEMGNHPRHDAMARRFLDRIGAYENVMVMIEDVLEEVEDAA